MNKRGNNGGKMTRIGERLHKEITRIMEEREKNKMYPISIEKITDLIVRHDEWPNVSEDILKIKEEEIKILWG